MITCLCRIAIPQSANCNVQFDFGRVRDFEVIDSYPFGVEFTWEKEGAPHTETLFKRAGLIPSTKMLTFFRYKCNAFMRSQARFSCPHDMPLAQCNYSPACLHKLCTTSSYTVCFLCDAQGPLCICCRASLILLYHSVCRIAHTT